MPCTTTKGLLGTTIRRTVPTVAVAGPLLGGGLASPALAQPEQSALVGVDVTGKEILTENDVGVGVAAHVAAAVGGVRVDVAVLAILEDVVDKGGEYTGDATTRDSVVTIDEAQ